jgi:hypothetical protein
MRSFENFPAGKLLPPALIILAVVAVFAPVLRSQFVLDDHFLIAISRLLANPFALFVNNHFPGGLFYRPVEMTFWWLSVEVFGGAPKWHYLINLALHAGVSVILWHLLRTWTQARAAALLGALAFAVHPITIGTALWLSDRFDLLAALFGLLALDAAWRYRSTLSRGALVASFVCVALAALSKETGFAAFAPLLLLWA